MGSFGILLVRVVVGLTMAGHGSQKLFGIFGGNGLARTGKFFESIGLKPGKTMAWMAGLGEFVGGLLFAAGFLTPLASLLIVATMLTAMIKVHAKNGYWVTNGGIEYNLVLLTAAVAVALTGPGAFRLTHG
ncbi:MAG TPA: DoxX family protein [Bacillales bacterium]|nr:DoxX family protein [Bacillales bacterium]